MSRLVPAAHVAEHVPARPAFPGGTGAAFPAPCLGRAARELPIYRPPTADAAHCCYSPSGVFTRRVTLAPRASSEITQYAVVGPASSPTFAKRRERPTSPEGRPWARPVAPRLSCVPGRGRAQPLCRQVPLFTKPGTIVLREIDGLLSKLLDSQLLQHRIDFQQPQERTSYY